MKQEFIEELQRKEDAPSYQCAVSFSLDMIGDKWTMLILRDMLFSSKTRYSDFLDMPEGIATNILSNRLKKMEARGLIVKSDDPDNKRRFIYGLTKKGLSLLPVVIEIMLWGYQFERAHHMIGKNMRAILDDRQKFEADIQSRFPHLQ